MQRQPYSLKSRLLITAGLVLLLFLGLMGIVLDQAFVKSAEHAVSERLQVQIYGLLSVTEVSGGKLYLPQVLQEPRFNNPGSGLFAQVLDGNAETLWQSPSSVSLPLELTSHKALYTSLEPGVGRFDEHSYSGDTRAERFFNLSYKFLWQQSDGVMIPYTLVVIESTASFESLISSYRNSLWGWLLAMIVVLVIIQVLVMRWGLSPLNELAADLKAIEDGDRELLDGAYPAELTAVTRNLNILLGTERQQREKYRTTLADLAHSLKTPLAILRGSGDQFSHQTGSDDSAAFVSLIDEQVDRMNQIVAYQLERAVADASTLIKKSIEVVPVVEKLVIAMSKVYRDKEIEIDARLETCTFFGDERDLMEMLGNVLDNACKYGTKNVRISTLQADSGELLITLEDDGPGIPARDRSKILTRGIRLDSQEAGQGIGMAVVVEIVERYNGSIEIQSSELGGASVRLTLS